MSEEWITAAAALDLVSRGSSRDTARFAICRRAHAGLLRAKAARFIRSFRDKQLVTDDEDVPKDFWWAEGEAALTQDWAHGDFETWVDHKFQLQAFNVSFAKAEIECMAAVASTPEGRSGSGAEMVGGGRPPAAWWDDLWVEITRQIYVGDLQPTKQADIEKAMMDWAAANGHGGSTGTMRPRARKLWAAIKDGN
jgi:hypothetical protein